ncbi:BsuPI-related putative proteinase inhibitor [Fictibacillus enclensis]|uniref:BsuPI-related putative proteinase inhibitor n=1 Tax=Fictibacillus TaxID=1329200 RepID=UPI001012A88C|nr:MULTISPECIES: BsuPI-related putative proteinase inhibitor [Fictibacillus]MDM5336978.1 BsuPI-related putative proteinase inhibitor [Fictibacillus enclensis]RXZ00174.1 proteinase inhibitor [Fictibacillus sp. S7]WHY73398.1 BsuPI-related putative proteinase inhibitor [Fictibacillus enclensis]
MKKWLLILSFTLLLGGCGTTEKNEADKGEPVMGDGNKQEQHKDKPGRDHSGGIVAGAIEPKLSVMEQNTGSTLLRYELKNQTEQIKTFEFTSGKKFDYIVKDESGKKVYQYSHDHMFTQSLSKITLKQGETFTQDIMVKNLPAGTYTIEIWLTAKNEENDYRQKKTFEIQ